MFNVFCMFCVFCVFCVLCALNVVCCVHPLPISFSSHTLPPF